ncbi:hypothetical protein [Kitasatospora sp. HPMI-4]|uniref:hypothetical protein n=1 Tax=Kitasatospora sp. HPMI-4 TaxID=3448443 RepID=UPI003F1D506E
MRVQPTSLVGAAVAAVLASGAPVAHAVSGPGSPSDPKAAQGAPAAAADQRAREDRGRRDEGKNGDRREGGHRKDDHRWAEGSHSEGSRAEGPQEEGRKPRGGVHTGGGGLAIPGGGLTSGVVLLGAGLGLGAYALRRRKAVGGVL